MLAFSADSCIRVLPAFVEAFAHKGKDAAVIQWAVDSAFRFFLLVYGPARRPAGAPCGGLAEGSGSSWARRAVGKMKLAAGEGLRNEFSQHGGDRRTLEGY